MLKNKIVLPLVITLTLWLSSCSMSDLKFWEKWDISIQEEETSTWTDISSSGNTLSWSIETLLSESDSALSKLTFSGETIKNNDYLGIMKFALANSYKNDKVPYKWKFSNEIHIKLPTINENWTLWSMKSQYQNLKVLDVKTAWVYDVTSSGSEFFWTTISLEFNNTQTWTVENGYDIDMRFIAYSSWVIDYRIDNMDYDKLIKLGVVNSWSILDLQKEYPSMLKENFKKQYTITGSTLNEFKNIIKENTASWNIVNSDEYEKIVTDLFNQIVIKSITGKITKNILDINYIFEYSYDNKLTNSNAESLSSIWDIKTIKPLIIEWFSSVNTDNKYYEMKGWKWKITIPMIDFEKQTKGMSDCMDIELKKGVITSTWNNSWTWETKINKCIDIQTPIYGESIYMNYEFDTELLDNLDVLSKWYNMSIWLKYTPLFSDELTITSSWNIMPFK